MSNEQSFERRVVAWVDDDADYRSVVKEWLEPRYEVREFANGQSFLNSLDAPSPDAIMLDLNLPDLDGFSICRRVRERGVGAPILFLTSSNDQDDFERHFEIDAAGYLMKPIGRVQLLSRLAELVDGERARAAWRSKDAPGWIPATTERHALRGTHKAY